MFPLPPRLRRRLSSRPFRYEHNENFTLSRPYELPGLYDQPTNATWATKSADSLDYVGLELWTGNDTAFALCFHCLRG